MKSSITYGENYSDKILVASFAGISDYLNIGMFCSIFPYIVASIDSGMSDNSLANYTALIESIYYCMEIIGAFLGGYLGDAFGKKFVILYCITGYIIAASLLGMAETFIMLTISKVLFGLMGGIMPNLRGYVLNVTDDSNMHSLYKYIGLCSAGTQILGPFAASALSYPNQNIPGLFSGTLWTDYPFLLPAIFQQLLFSIAVSLIGMILVIVFMCPQASKGFGTKVSSKNIYTRQFLLINVVNAIYGFIQKAFLVSFTIFCKIQVQNGGLGWENATLTGLTITIASALSVVMQGLLTPYLIKKYHILFTIKFYFLISPIAYLILPLATNLSPQMQLLYMVLCFFIGYVCIDSAYVPISMAIINSVPHSHQGKANGVSMSVVACFRALGYLSFGLLFGACIGNEFPFGVTLPFWILTFVTLAGVLVAQFGLDDRVNKRVMESEPLLDREN